MAFTSLFHNALILQPLSCRNLIFFLIQVVWFVEEPAQSGDVYGYMNKWKGLGVVFDSFDNDGKRNNPYISVVVNDGEMEYDHAT